MIIYMLLILCCIMVGTAFATIILNILYDIIQKIWRKYENRI